MEAIDSPASAVVERCLRRVRHWLPPPKWSWRDWLEEAAGCAALSVSQAETEYDPGRGVPLDAFIYKRVMGAVRTRYRQEWAHAGLCCWSVLQTRRPAGVDGRNGTSDNLLLAGTLEELLDGLSEDDRLILRQTFWHGRTQADLARCLGISQQAISKRKAALLQTLRALLQS